MQIRRPSRRRARRPGLRRGLPVVLAASLVSVLCAACSSSGSGTTLTLYNGQHPQTTDALVSAFEKATGITVAVRSADEDTLADEIVTEGSHSPADVIYTENSPALEYLESKGLLSHLDASTLSHTPSRFSSPAGDWVGVSARVSVLIYNPSLIKRSELPTSVLALGEARYRGEIAIAPAETDFQPIVTSVARTYGTARALSWLDGLKQNAGSHVYPDNETITNDVNRGIVAFGIINQYYWYRLRAEIGASNMHSAITYFAPRDPGYVLDVSGAAVLASSTHQKAAQRLVAFLVSKKAQEIIATSDSYEYPIASGVTTRQPETPFDDLRPNGITIPELGDGSEAISLLQRAGLL